MAVYVLHIEPPYRHAGHYIGFSTRPDPRIAEHFSGRGSPLIKAAIEAGHEVTVALKWHCGTRQFERFLKNMKGTRKICPCCNPRAKRVTFAAFARYLRAGGTVRPSRKYFAMARFAGVSIGDVMLMSAAERRAIVEKMSGPAPVEESGRQAA